MVPEFIITFTFLLFHSSISSGQSNPGARITAMGQTTATADGLSAVYGNPAGITAAKHPSFLLGYATYPATPEISTQFIAALWPAGRNGFGFGLQRYGLSEFYTLSAAFVYGKEFGKMLSLGIRLKYHQVNASNYGALSGFTADAGIMVVLSRKVALGAYITNLAQQEYSAGQLDFTIPSNFNLGASWQATDQVVLTGMIEKQIGLPLDIKSGLSYMPEKRFSLRGGVTLKPIHHFAGFGFTHKRMVVDFAVASNVYTGYQPQIDISYAW